MDLTEVTSAHGNPNRYRPTKNRSAHAVTDKSSTARFDSQHARQKKPEKKWRAQQLVATAPVMSTTVRP